MKSSTWSALAVSIVALGLISGCYTYSGTDYGYRAPAGAYTYDYYPDCEVYYGVSSRLYFWSADGVWCHGPRLPGTIVIRPERRVVVRLDTAEPYRHHAEIRVQHPASRPPAPTWAERRHVDVAVQRYRYVYYPESRVYYRSDSRTYFWRDGADWRSARTLPPRIGLRVEGRVTVELDSPEPAKHHEEVEKQHPGRGHAYGHDKQDNRDRRKER
jgi:hypothetical protein